MDATECKSRNEHDIGLCCMLTFQQGLVTAAQKLNRKGLVNKYRKEIDVAYGSS